MVAKKKLQLSKIMGLIKVYCLFDTSPSMEGGKINDAREAINAMINIGKENTNLHLEIISFNSSVEILQKMSPATLIKPLPPISTRGGTNLEIAIKEVLKRDEGSKNKEVIVIVCSDGLSSVCPKASAEIAKTERGFGIVTIAFGEDADKGTLEEIATSKEHFFNCFDGTALRTLFSSISKVVSLPNSNVMKEISLINPLDN